MLALEVPKDVKDGIAAAVCEMISPEKWAVTAVYVSARSGYEFKIKYEARSQPSSGRLVPDAISGVTAEPPLGCLGVASRDVVRDLLAWHSSSL